MSRSYKKTPIHSWASCRSERWNKQDWHRRYRRAVRQAIYREAEVMPHFREHSNVWLMGKDGKSYWPKPTVPRVWWWTAQYRSYGFKPKVFSVKEQLKDWSKMMRK